jgi:hypothetical protein
MKKIKNSSFLPVFVVLAVIYGLGIFMGYGADEVNVEELNMYAMAGPSATAPVEGVNYEIDPSQTMTLQSLAEDCEDRDALGLASASLPPECSKVFSLRKL